MRTFSSFLERPHNLKPTTIKTYKVSIDRWQNITQKPFEETYLNEAAVNKTLKILEEKLEPSTWNTSLQRYKRLAKYLYDPKDEEVPVVWRQQKEKKIDWNQKLKEKFLTKAEFSKIIDAVDETSEVSNNTGNYFFYTFTEAGAYNWSVVVTSEDGNFTPAYDFTVLVVDRGELSTYDVAALALLIVGVAVALPVALIQKQLKD